MIKAELYYNPYLMEIDVRFNGQPPHINSLIEKYQNKPLQDWIDAVPQIFHDEMNGYYFELDFSGTALDCDEVRETFRRAGVSENEVPVFLKNELESREEKIGRIDELLVWLDENRYRRFDVEAFRKDNSELFDEDYPCMILHGISKAPDLPNISVESVSDITELDCTDLTHTPILFCVTEESLTFLSGDIKYLSERHDFNGEQLFFCIDAMLNSENIRRLIADFGVSKPNIVADINDEAIRKYFLIYPFNDYISSAIKAFRNTVDELSDVLSTDKEMGMMKGDRMHQQLSVIDDCIERIKTADEQIVQHDNLEYPPEFKNAIELFKNSISSWESRKTKITDPAAAATAAANLNAAYKEAFREYCAALKKLTVERGKKIRTNFLSIYRKTLLDNTFVDKVEFTVNTEQYGLNDQIQELLEMKEEKYVNVRNSIFFKSDNNDQEPTTVLVTTYYLQTWRSHLLDASLPVAEKIASLQYEYLKQ